MMINNGKSNMFRSSLVIICLFSLNGCYYNSTFIQRLDSLIEEGNENKIFKQEEVFLGEWDKIHAISGIACADEIKEITGLDYPHDDCIQDDEIYILFEYNKKIVKKQQIKTEEPYIEFNFNYIDRSNSKGIKIMKTEESYIITSEDI